MCMNIEHQHQAYSLDENVKILNKVRENNNLGTNIDQIKYKTEKS